MGLRGRGGGCGSRGILCRCLIVFGWFFVAGERDIGGGFEELLPKLGAFPNAFGVLCVVFDDGKDTCSDYAVGATEIVIDLCIESIGRRLLAEDWMTDLEG